MKNSKSILIGTIGVIVICLITTGCLFNNALKPEDFKSHFEDMGYVVSDNNESEYEAETKYVATKEGQDYNILYYEFANEVDAKKVYKNYKDNLTDYITSDSQNTETNGAAFSKFVAVSTNEYIVISRVKNTVIFILGTNDVSKDIDQILTDIKY